MQWLRRRPSFKNPPGIKSRFLDQWVKNQQDESKNAGEGSYSVKDHKQEVLSKRWAALILIKSMRVDELSVESEELGYWMPNVKSEAQVCNRHPNARAEDPFAERYR
jgi:hypothetical protein